MPLQVSVLLANFGTELGLTLFALAVHRFLNGRAARPWLWWLFGSQMLLLLAVLPLGQPTRVAVVSLSHALLMLPMLWWLHRAGPQREAMVRAVTWSLLVSELLLVFRGLDAAWHPQIYDGVLIQGWRQGMAYASAYLFLLGAGFGFALANLERVALRLNELASIDPLTGCLNRRAADERLREALDGSAQRPPTVLTLVLLDLDHFKQVNDRHGHHCGDRALQHFAALARIELGERSILARLGGEEFGIWLPGQGGGEGLQLAERLRRAVAATDLRDREGQPVVLTVSAGVASLRLPAPTAVDRTSPAAVERIDLCGLYTRADQALYRAKAAGRNRVEADGAPALGAWVTA
jgi:diguanylate cyclase (GGDEF)-like protein